MTVNRSADRARALRRVGHRYKRFHQEPQRYTFDRYEFESEPCAYCGAPSNSIDHVPPVMMMDMLVDIDVDARGKLYPSCRECNSWLSSKSLRSLSERAAYVRSKLWAKMTARDKFVHWDEEELEEMGPNLRREIRAYDRRAIMLRARHSWATDVAAGRKAMWREDATVDAWGKVGT